MNRITARAYALVTIIMLTKKRIALAAVSTQQKPRNIAHTVKRLVDTFTPRQRATQSDQLADKGCVQRAIAKGTKLTLGLLLRKLSGG